MLSILRPDELKGAKRGFSTRRVPIEDMQSLISDGEIRPQPGDLVLARIAALGHHSKFERPDGRRAQLYVGDRVIVCFGNRYGPDQFEAAVPADLGSCDLVAAGGIASVALSWHRRVAAPTRIEPIGLIGDAAGQRLNVARYALPPTRLGAWNLPTILVIGESMNAGKSTTAAALVRGLAQAGHKVGAIKATGTGAGGDLWLMHDAGAAIAADFTDAGFASTYRVPAARLEPGIERLVSHVAGAACTAVIIEVADGVLQAETAALLRGQVLSRLQASVMFACGGAMAGAHGVAWLRAAGYQVIGLSGCIDQSPLAMREVEAVTGLRCFSAQTLALPEIALSILANSPARGLLDGALGSVDGQAMPWPVAPGVDHDLAARSIRDDRAPSAPLACAAALPKEAPGAPAVSAAGAGRTNGQG